jgi:hypothetical protein
VIPGVDFVVGATAACIHYSALKGDLSRMEARREMDIKELTAKAAEFEAILREELYCKCISRMDLWLRALRT